MFCSIAQIFDGPYLSSSVALMLSALTISAAGNSHAHSIPYKTTSQYRDAVRASSLKSLWASRVCWLLALAFSCSAVATNDFLYKYGTQPLLGKIEQFAGYVTPYIPITNRGQHTAAFDGHTTLTLY